MILLSVNNVSVLQLKVHLRPVIRTNLQMRLRKTCQRVHLCRLVAESGRFLQAGLRAAAGGNSEGRTLTGQMQMTRRNWYRFRMRPGCVRMRRDASWMRRDFELWQISANSGKIPAKF